VLFLASDESSKVIDAALGVLERGTWNVADAVKQQPWLPNGPIPLNVTWTRRGRASSIRSGYRAPHKSVGGEYGQRRRLGAVEN
jgi:hypothetical protein